MGLYPADGERQTTFDGNHLGSACGRSPRERLATCPNCAYGSDGACYQNKLGKFVERQIARKPKLR
jgi:hypothetical protein